MSSHGGQQDFPFGYQPRTIHGIGLPDFMNPGPPPGQPLLNDHESADLNSFFQDFDTDPSGHKHGAQPQYHMGQAQTQGWDMPPNFVMSDTQLGPRSGIHPQQLQMGGYTFDGMFGQDMATMPLPQAFENGMHGPAFPDHSNYQQPLLHQLQTAAQSLSPGYTHDWHQNLPHNLQQPPGMHIPAGSRVAMRFGSDGNFRHDGYIPPQGPVEATDMLYPADWIESATNTQPNTQPNTEPSSPSWSKKRKLDEFQHDQRRNGFKPANGHQISAQPSPPNSNPRGKKRSLVKNELQAISQPPTPLTASKPQTPRDPESADHDGDEDAEGEDEEVTPIAPEEDRSPSPGPWPASKARPPRTPKPPPKPSRSRKKSSATTANTTTLKPRPKTQRASSSQTASTRKPLTQEQKKANHTNSEQRRRDATARAFAELYDLVPELEDMGKQSTMKKLEIVVAKVTQVKGTVEELRHRLGLDPLTGQAAPAGGGVVVGWR